MGATKRIAGPAGTLFTGRPFELPGQSSHEQDQRDPVTHTVKYFLCSDEGPCPRPWGDLRGAAPRHPRPGKVNRKWRRWREGLRGPGSGEAQGAREGGGAVETGGRRWHDCERAPTGADPSFSKTGGGGGRRGEGGGGAPAARWSAKHR